MNSFPCPHCRNEVGHNPELAGQIASCPHCGKLFRAPDDAKPYPIIVGDPVEEEEPITAKVVNQVKRLPEIDPKHIITAIGVAIILWVLSVPATYVLVYSSITPDGSMGGGYVIYRDTDSGYGYKTATRSQFNRMRSAQAFNASITCPSCFFIIVLGCLGGIYLIVVANRKRD